MIKYEKHEREYTVLGATSCMKSALGIQTRDFFGAGMTEIVSVVKDGVYYHLQIEGERLAAARKFLQRVNGGELDLEKEYENFVNIVTEYENFILQSAANFSLETIVKLFKYYDDMMPVALAALDSADVIDELPQNKRDDFSAWAAKVRVREELIYKDGEMKFMPRYLDWLSQNHLANYSPENLKYLVYKEILDYIINREPLPSLEILENRKKLFFISQKPSEEINLYQGHDAQKMVDKVKVFSQDEHKNIKEINGVVAFAGKVQGKVRLIRSRADLVNFQDNEIIISPMTDPSYLPIMKKALAFVTDEGGILCHAAIVARELRKPCVIGTKIATSIFKDGDMVDAGNGVVKKL